MRVPNQVALIFDLDNTLVHSHIDFIAVRHQLIDRLERAGASPGSRTDLLRLSLPELVDLGERVDPALGVQMWEVIGQAEQQGLAQATVVDHAADVMAALRAQGYRIALLTNNAREGVVERLEAFRLAQYFDVIATRDDVPGLKPSPEGIHYVLSRLPEVRRAYMIGDAWIDGRAAAGAGARFIGFGEKQAAVLERGVTVWAWITDLRQLLELDLEG